MKKYDEGYTLPFVLVIFLVLSLVATSILTISLRNLQSQKDSILRMEYRYAAQGEIEKVEELITAEIMTYKVLSEHILNGVRNKVDCDIGDPEKVGTDESIDALTLTAESKKGTVQVTAIFRITGSKITRDGYGIYMIETPNVVCDAYSITAIEADGGEAQ